ncbi:MAG: MBL fold metallo-hydrolase [Pseudomonadota bacterium]
MTRSLPAWIDALPHGVHVIDTGFHRPRFDASYLLVEEGQAVFIDTGTNASVPRLLEALSVLGLGVDAVDWVIATHVHLDHAGGVGLLMQALPQARLLVHPRGAPHLIDPTRLVQGAQAVYGVEAVARTYGTLVPVPAERVTSSADGMTLHWTGRPLQLLDTPGHARHHHCVWDARSGGVFTGDTFGLSYAELHTPNGPYLLPSSTPVQFDPVALRHSVQRLLDLQPQAVYLTHYGAVQDVARSGAQLLRQLDAMVACAQQINDTGQAGAERHGSLCETLSELYLSELRSQGSTLDTEAIRQCLAVDIELNAQGLAVWLDSRQQRAPS